MTDTSPEMQEILDRRLEEMSPSEKVRAMVDLWDTGHALQCAGIRQQFPEADEAEVIYQVAVRRFGEELARKVYKR